MRRDPTSKVRETQVRWQALREGIRGQADGNHNHRQLANLSTRTTALSNSVKLSHAVWGQVMVGVMEGFVVILSGIRAGEYSSNLHLNRIPRAAK